MRCFVIFAFIALAYAFPADPRDAEVIQITDKDAPIFLNSENDVVPRNTNATSNESPSAPSPIPDSQPVTEKQPEANTPNLVPTVVDISTTPNPASAVPPANATTTPSPDEEDEESEEDESEEEEADEEEDDDEDEEEEDADEEEDEEEDDVAGKTLNKKRVTRQVDEEIGGSVKIPATKPSPKPIVDSVEEERSDEEEQPLIVESNVSEKLKPNLVSGSRLQGIPARSPTNEDDELDNKGL
ncbi:unnamed protein product [Orchesella dallaii]|uniref:Uncharacterized protein n=1 Tax=Orchesella dallaii TaxID=48710 RepID=A0ABP1QMD8_9HEXA